MPKDTAMTSRKAYSQPIWPVRQAVPEELACCISSASIALAAFVTATDHDNRGEAVRDLIIDLAHWCDAQKLDAHAIINRALNHWWIERGKRN